MRYRRFAAATAIASLAWSMLWVLGGAALGTAFLEYTERAAYPALIAAIAAAAYIAVRMARRHVHKAPR